MNQPYELWRTIETGIDVSAGTASMIIYCLVISQSEIMILFIFRSMDGLNASNR